MSDRQRGWKTPMDKIVHEHKRVPILIFLFLIVFILFINNSCFLEENPKVVEDPYLWDFGRVKEGSILKHTFILKNESKTTLIINKLQTSCGCTGSVVSTCQIPAGKTSKIKVTFNTKGYSGKTKQFVYVHTSDPKNPIIKLTLEAEVIKKK